MEGRSRANTIHDGSRISFILLPVVALDTPLGGAIISAECLMCPECCGCSRW